MGRNVWLLPTWKVAFAWDREVPRWAAGEGQKAVWQRWQEANTSIAGRVLDMGPWRDPKKSPSEC